MLNLIGHGGVVDRLANRHLDQREDLVGRVSQKATCVRRVGRAANHALAERQIDLLRGRVVNPHAGWRLVLQAGKELVIHCRSPCPPIGQVVHRSSTIAADNGCVNAAPVASTTGIGDPPPTVGFTRSRPRRSVLLPFRHRDVRREGSPPGGGARAATTGRPVHRNL